MCGICGFYGYENKDLIRKMCDLMHYRGPDDKGYYSDGLISIGNRRLSILDVNLGKQPIHNEEETVWIVFNGEIYNYESLKERYLKNHKFYTKSDTEVIIHLYEELGSDFIKELNGIFALAIWDTKNRTLVLGRDHLGIKPLYYSHFNNEFIFASEIKSILLHERERYAFDESGVNFNLVFDFTPHPRTLFKNIYKLQPGSLLVLQDNKVEIKRFYNLFEYSPLKSISFSEAVKHLDTTLRRTIKMEMVSDVPLGVQLSGGVDSSTIAAYASKVAQGPIDTFTFSLDDEDEDFKNAKLVADTLGTNHYEKIIDFKDTITHLPGIMWHLEEPFENAVAIPHYFLSKFACEKVKVLLSGDGADELFGGYNYYLPATFSHKFYPLKIINKTYRDHLAISYFYRYARGLKGFKSIFRSAGRFTPKEEWDSNFKNNSNINKFLEEFNMKSRQRDMLNKCLLFDMYYELPDLQLLRADKMSMAHSVELRVPFLNKDVLSVVKPFPPQFKISEDLTTKRILKEVANKYLPKKIVSRKKRGWGSPLKKWFDTEFGEIVKHRMDNSQLIKKLEGDKHLNLSRIHNKPQKTADFIRQYNLFTLDLWYRTFVENDDIRSPLKEL